MAEGLTNKQQSFINHYFATHFNATKAAELAGYTHPNVQGPRLLVNVSIAEEISRRMEELAMPANEVLARLGEHARGNIGAFIRTNEDGKPDGFSLSAERPLHMVKKVTVTDKGWSFEMYDAQAALVHIGKHHGLFSNDSDDWQAALTKMGINASDFLAQLSQGIKQATS
jgi:phage terminase small subunit